MLARALETPRPRHRQSLYELIRRAFVTPLRAIGFVLLMFMTVIASVLRVLVGRFVVVFVRKFCGRFTRDPRSRGAQAHGVVRRGSVLRRAFAFMLVFTLLSTCAGVGLSLRANATAHASKGTTFMIISGITSGSEMCLTAAGLLQRCTHVQTGHTRAGRDFFHCMCEVSRRSFCRASSRSVLERGASFGLSRRRAL